MKFFLLITAIFTTVTRSKKTIFVPSPCESATPGLNTEIPVKLSDIAKWGNEISDSIANRNNFLDLIEQRIFGSLRLTWDLVDDAKSIMLHLDEIKNNDEANQNYAKYLKNAWFDSFLECDSASCAIENFCNSLVRLPSSKNNDNSLDWKTASDWNLSTINGAAIACNRESWRFAQFMLQGNLDEQMIFDFVPFHSQEKCSAEG